MAIEQRMNQRSGSATIKELGFLMVFDQFLDHSVIVSARVPEPAMQLVRQTPARNEQSFREFVQRMLDCGFDAQKARAALRQVRRGLAFGNPAGDTSQMSLALVIAGVDACSYLLDRAGLFRQSRALPAEEAGSQLFLRELRDAVEHCFGAGSFDRKLARERRAIQKDPARGGGDDDQALAWIGETIGWLTPAGVAETKLCEGESLAAAWPCTGTHEALHALMPRLEKALEKSNALLYAEIVATIHTKYASERTSPNLGREAIDWLIEKTSELSRRPEVDLDPSDDASTDGASSGAIAQAKAAVSTIGRLGRTFGARLRELAGRS